MRELPKIADTTIRVALLAHCGISIAALNFLPLGNDFASAVYRVETADGAAYFLKTRTGRVSARRSGISPDQAG